MFLNEFTEPSGQATAVVLPNAKSQEPRQVNKFQPRTSYPRPIRPPLDFGVCSVILPKERRSEECRDPAPDKPSNQLETALAPRAPRLAP